jgi:cytochrome c oxidase assembly protein subunit 15
LSIPDFPTAYGRIFPPIDAASVARINEARKATDAPISSGLILLQYIHRVWAVLIVVGLTSVAVKILRRRQLTAPVHSAAGFWLVLVLTQFGLGAWTIWSNKAADIATSHVFVGALTLMTGVLLSVILSAMLSPPSREEDSLRSAKREVARA